LSCSAHAKLASLNREKRQKLYLDFHVLLETQEITPQVVDDRIGQLERLSEGTEWHGNHQRLKKPVSGKGSMPAVKRGSDGDWVCEEQSALSFREDGGIPERTVVESFRTEHVC
jgi:hypothetical protein